MRVLVMNSMIALAAFCLTPRPAAAIVCANCAQEITQLLNYGELVFQAAKSAEEVAIAVRNIQALAQNFGPDIGQSMNAVRSILGTVQRVTYQVGQSEEAFLSRYQQAFGIAGVPEGMFGQSAAQVYLDSRDDMTAAMQESVRVRSMAAQAMQLQAAQENAAGSASQAAAGMLQAQQAGNALIQSVGSRLSNLQATLISYHETQVRAQRDGVLEQMVADVAHARNMSCFGEGKSTILVDPWGMASSIKGTEMIKELLIVVLQWVDPTVHVVPVTQVHACIPMESTEEIARVDRAMKKNMDGLGKPMPGAIVDPWGTLSDSQREALERRGAR